MNVGKNAALGYGDARQQLVQLLVVPNSQLDVARSDALLLVVPASVSGKLQNFCAEVLKSTRALQSARLGELLLAYRCERDDVGSLVWYIFSNRESPDTVRRNMYCYAVGGATIRSFNNVKILQETT